MFDFLHFLSSRFYFYYVKHTSRFDYCVKAVPNYQAWSFVRSLICSISRWLVGSFFFSALCFSIKYHSLVYILLIWNKRAIGTQLNERTFIAIVRSIVGITFKCAAIFNDYTITYIFFNIVCFYCCWFQFNFLSVGCVRFFLLFFSTLLDYSPFYMCV